MLWCREALGGEAWERSSLSSLLLQRAHTDFDGAVLVSSGYSLLALHVGVYRVCVAVDIFGQRSVVSVLRCLLGVRCSLVVAVPVNGGGRVAGGGGPCKSLRTVLGWTCLWVFHVVGLQRAPEGPCG